MAGGTCRPGQDEHGPKLTDRNEEVGPRRRATSRGAKLRRGNLTQEPQRKERGVSRLACDWSSFVCVGPTDPPPLPRILQGPGRRQGAPDPVPDPIPTSISIIYRSRDSFAFGNHRLTLAPDPAGSGTGSASKMSSDPSDPLGSAKDEGTRRTGSASKRSPDPPDPLGFAEGWEAQRSCAASKLSPVPRAPLGLAHDQYAGGPLRYAVKKGFVRACKNM